MTASVLCIRWGLLREDHVHNAVGLLHSQQLRCDDASRHCTSYSSGDPDADLFEENQRKLESEEEYLNELRAHSKPKTHWD